MKQHDNMQIGGAPTKALFIDMLVKDIPIIYAIIDLVDNAVDGALRQQPNGDYSRFFIHIEFDGDHFKIVDNCGGISVNMARNDAFCFGKPIEAKLTPGSIGHVGLGMKRALFRLGKQFQIESTTENSRFIVEENVAEWKQKLDWHFEFKALEQALENVSSDDIGTMITVTSLQDEVSENFQLETFKTLFLAELQSAHSLNIDRGLTITLNGRTVQPRSFFLLNSKQLKPAFLEMTIKEKPELAPVVVKIFAGISKRDLSKGGWYIFCNDRLVLKADQTQTTGWGKGNESRIPKYHPDFAYFRGYVSLESEDASRLPWNTTKTGVDIDSPIFKAVRLYMVTLSRPVIDFLRELAAEKIEGVQQDDTPLEKALKEAKLKKLSESYSHYTFLAPRSESL